MTAASCCSMGTGFTVVAQSGSPNHPRGKQKSHIMMSHGLPRVEMKRASHRPLSMPHIAVLSPLIQSVGTVGAPGWRKVCSQFEHTRTPGAPRCTAST